MTGWEEVTPEPDASPFGVEKVDGIVYDPTAESPEIGVNPDTLNIPAPPRREPPKPINHSPVDPWRPGPAPTPVAARRANRTNPFVGIFFGLIPIVLVAAVALLVWRLY